MRSDGKTENGIRIYFLEQELRVLLAVLPKGHTRRKVLDAVQKLEARASA